MASLLQVCVGRLPEGNAGIMDVVPAPESPSKDSPEASKMLCFQNQRRLDIQGRTLLLLATLADMGTVKD